MSCRQIQDRVRQNMAVHLCSVSVPTFLTDLSRGFVVYRASVRGGPREQRQRCRPGRRSHEGLDVMIHTIGMYVRHDISEISQAEWDATLAVNLRSFFLCTQAAIRSMAARNEGRIIGITSSIGTVGRPRSAAYAASKAAMQAFTRAVAVDLVATGITINCIGPGITESQLMRGANSAEKIAASLTRSGRPVSSPEAIVGPVRYLLSEATRTVSGTTLWMRPPR